MKLNKKAATVDNFWAVIGFFGLAIFALAIITFWNATSAVSELWTGSSIGSGIQAEAQRAVNTIDFICVMAYFGLHLGIIFMAYLLRTHPFIYLAGIILTAILALVAAPISNAYEEVIADTALNTASTTIPITNFIISQLPMLEVVWAFVTLIVMFGFARNEGMV